MQSVALRSPAGRCCPFASSPASQGAGARRAAVLRVRAASSNGSSAHGVEAAKQGGSSPQAVELLEMVVADDMRAVPGAQRRLVKRLVPAPHQASAALAAQPPGAATLGQPLNGRKPTGFGNGSGPQLSPAAQQLVARQAAGTSKAGTAELSLARRENLELQVELKTTRRDLSVKEAEVVGLRQELAERDGKLKAARADLLESRMTVQQKDAQLKVAYAQLSEAVRERSTMRTQLAQTHAELAETRAELEQLADDILAIKLLMDDDDGEGGDSYLEGSSNTTYYYTPVEQQHCGDSDDGLDVLHSLAALTRQLAQDAKDDDAIYTQSIAAEQQQPNYDSYQ